MSFQDICEDMAFLENWEERLGYVIDLGKSMPKLKDVERNELTRVTGCASNVWIVPDLDDGLHFRGESDASIVQGLIAVLLTIVNEKTPSEIIALDIQAEFDKLGLKDHISGQRSNGLTSMIGRIKSTAQKLQNA